MKGITKNFKKCFGKGSSLVLAFLIVVAGVLGTLSTVKVSAKNTFSKETTKLEEVQFSYAYDVQRTPAYPKKGDVIKAYSLSGPVLGPGQSRADSQGSWTLTNMGTYSNVKDSVENPEYLADIVADCVSRYGELNEDDIVIHELKDNGKHIAYGVAVAYDSENGYVVFLADALMGGAGYLLSTTEQTSEVEIVANLDITDWVAPTMYEITASAGEHGSISPSGSVNVAEGNSKTFTITADEGYEIESLTVDGTNVSVADSYTFADVKESHSIQVTFKQIETEDPAVEVPVIAVQPKEATNKAGEEATFTVEATGTDLVYQWQIDRNDGNGFVDIAEATGNSYTTSTLDKDCNGFKYQCIISNSAGSVTSEVVVLTVIDEEQPTEPPTTEPPVTVPPTTEPPVTEAPTTEPPVTEAPTTEAPVTEAPTTEAPVTEVPTTEAPVTEAPTTETPATKVPTTVAPVTETPGSNIQNNQTNNTQNNNDAEVKNTNEQTAAPKTGDTNSVVLWISIMGASIICLGGVILKRKDKCDC